MLPWWPDVTIIQYDVTIVVPYQLSTVSKHDYIFSYCLLVGILFAVLRIVLILIYFHEMLTTQKEQPFSKEMLIKSNKDWSLWLFFFCWAWSLQVVSNVILPFINHLHKMAFYICVRSLLLLSTSLIASSLGHTIKHLDWIVV